MEKKCAEEKFAARIEKFSGTFNPENYNCNSSLYIKNNRAILISFFSFFFSPNMMATFADFDLEHPVKFSPKWI